jgi:hypothetical protein
VQRCPTEVATQPWSVVVLHDLPTGVMSHLPGLLDGLDALCAEVVQEFPESCVPIRRGVCTGPLGHLIRP